MHTKIMSFEEFLSKFSLRKDTSFAEFSNNVTVIKYHSADSSGVRTLDEFIKKYPTRGRKERLLAFKKALYKMIVVEPEVSLRVWYNSFASLPNELSYYFNFPNNPVLVDKEFRGAINSKYGRVCRSINFETAYATRKINTIDTANRLLMTDLKLMFEEFVINYKLPNPYFFDIVLQIEERGPEFGYKEFWKHLMIWLNKPSILNPYTYREILHELFTGETLFAPCMSWNSCQVAFYNSHFNHFISTDVIPSVVENGRNLHLDWQDWNNSQAVIFPEDKTADLYLCPSEQLQKRHGFIDKYNNKVDAVLFCPPYFDLELYDSPEQSVDSFPDYLDWLRGYWEETVKTCVEVMRPGARFGFIISDYAYLDYETTLRPISHDMANIVRKHLTFKDKMGVRWNKPIHKKASIKTKDGLLEDLWLFEKR